MYLGESAQMHLREVDALATPGDVLILNFIEHPGFTRGVIVESLGGGWTDLQFNMYGDDVLSFGRFKDNFPPSPAFSFLVCRKEKRN